MKVYKRSKGINFPYYTDKDEALKKSKEQDLLMLEILIEIDDETNKEKEARVSKAIKEIKDEHLKKYGTVMVSTLGLSSLEATLWDSTPVIKAWRLKNKPKQSPRLRESDVLTEEKEAKDDFEVFDLSEYHSFIRRTKNFLRSRRAISLKKFCDEINVSYLKTLKYLDGREIMPNGVKKRFIKNLQEYGFKED